MSGNSSRKYKQYLEMLERRKYFGDIPIKDEFGIVQLTAYGAAHGTAMYRTTRYDLGRIPISKKEKARPNEALGYRVFFLLSSKGGEQDFRSDAGTDGYKDMDALAMESR